MKKQDFCNDYSLRELDISPTVSEVEILRAFTNPLGSLDLSLQITYYLSY